MYAQHGREYQKLHKLHNNVNKGLSVPIIGTRTPTFSYATGSQPQISFLNLSVSTSNLSGKPSSDYGDGWMDDFPSPSLLLDNNRSNSKRLLERNIPQAPEKAAFDGDSASSHAGHEDDGDWTKTFNEEKRKTIDLKPRCCAIDQRGTSTPPLPKLPRVVFGKWEGMKSIGSDDRLFCSVDSPEKTTSPLEKRKLAASPEPLRPEEKPDIERRSRTVSPQIFRYSSDNEFHRAKKRRVSDSSNEQVLLLSIDEAGQSQPSLKVRRPISEASKGPQPVWVDECDPDFVAEDADFMGFI